MNAFVILRTKFHWGNKYWAHSFSYNRSRAPTTIAAQEFTAKYYYHLSHKSIRQSKKKEC